MHRQENQHIFYTDDDIDDREFFNDALGDIAPQLLLVTANDGDALLKLLHNPPPEPSIIFLDLNMPGKTGYQVLESIRANDKTRDYPVVIFSTSNDEKAIEKTRMLGANMFITKPKDYAGIKRIIETCLSINWNDHKTTVENFLLRN